MTKLTGAFRNYAKAPKTNTDKHRCYMEQNKSDKSKTCDCFYSSVSHYCSTDSLHHRVPNLVHTHLVHVLDLVVFTKS
jgi:hypothetical protein